MVLRQIEQPVPVPVLTVVQGSIAIGIIEGRKGTVGQDLESVTQVVHIGVGLCGIGAKMDFEEIGELITVMILQPISGPVAVGVGVGGIESQLSLDLWRFSIRFVGSVKYFLDRFWWLNPITVWLVAVGWEVRWAAVFTVYRSDSNRQGWIQ